MPDYPPGYDPSQADYTNPSGYISPGDQAIGGLIGLTAFAAIGIGAFFTAGTAVTGTITTVTYTVVSPAGNTTLTYASGTALTQAQAATAALIEAGELNSEPVAVMAILSSWGMRMLTLDSLIALAAYNSDPAYGPGFFNPGPGGFYGVPHSFPGVGFLPAGPPGSYWGCIGINQGALECTLYF